MTQQKPIASRVRRIWSAAACRRLGGAVKVRLMLFELKKVAHRERDEREQERGVPTVEPRKQQDIGIRRKWVAGNGLGQNVGHNQRLQRRAHKHMARQNDEPQQGVANALFKEVTPAQRNRHDVCAHGEEENVHPRPRATGPALRARALHGHGKKEGGPKQQQTPHHAADLPVAKQPREKTPDAARDVLKLPHGKNRALAAGENQKNRHGHDEREEGVMVMVQGYFFINPVQPCHQPKPRGRKEAKKGRRGHAQGSGAVGTGRAETRENRRVQQRGKAGAHHAHREKCGVHIAVEQRRGKPGLEFARAGAQADGGHNKPEGEAEHQEVADKLRHGRDAQQHGAQQNTQQRDRGAHKEE